MGKNYPLFLRKGRNYPQQETPDEMNFFLSGTGYLLKMVSDDENYNHFISQRN